ncbi:MULTISPECIES: DUF2156 domain-containing protein [unclassified Helicobacter]|uniref:DUF2156 domain-containing protein n=1 Tax=unclassified Helicobacter TaxID=2593540 RepID=UPI000CF0C4B4|nr:MULTISPECIES: phosphatidylglycerol lysyltransferase domain-containing protein [unclassified Helicobacter]
MLNFKEIELEDQEIIQKFLQEDEFKISDISFVNLFLWRKARRIAYAIFRDCLIIQTTYKNQNPFYFFPIGKGDKLEAIKILVEFCKARSEVLEFHSLEQTSVDFLKKFFGEAFIFTLNRDRSDYVYSIEELISLSGRKYHKKKNHLNRFLQTYPNFTFERIDEKNTNELLEVWKQWFEIQENPSIGLINENIGIIEVLKNWGELEVSGGLIRVNNKIIAFSFGEVVSKEMAVIHIEKADSNFHGAYQIINQQLLANIFSHIKYANREEDLGIEGLRRAKMSYNPVFLVEKYEASLNQR